MEKQQYKGQEGFEIFHTSKPEVYKLYKIMALVQCELGNKIGSSYLIERIRWEYGMSIPNNTVPYYARRFVKDYPEFEKLFKFTKAK